MSQSDTDFGNGGTISRHFADYQERVPQKEMANAVERCIKNQESAVIEAKTGTGKSLAYLVPAVHEAVGAGKKIVVSTSNKALQAQVFNKDIPFVRLSIAEFEAVLLKGMNNYLCLDRLNKSFIRASDQDFIAKLKEHEGDFEKLPIQNEEIQSMVNGRTDECIGKHCPHYGQCFYYNMKRSMDKASVIVTNHTILLMDIDLGGRMLPAYDVLVIDEAHNLEKEAQEVFSSKVTVGRFLSLISDTMVKEAVDVHSMNNAFEVNTEEIEDVTSTLFLNIGNLFSDLPKDKLVLTSSFLASIKPLGRELEDLVHLVGDAVTERAEDLVRCSIKSEDFEKNLHSLPNETRVEAARYRKLSERASKLAGDVQRIFLTERHDHVCIATRSINKSGHTVYEASSIPLDVSEVLRDELFGVEKTIICTSATLTSATIRGNETFDLFTKRVGMVPDEIHNLPHVFDYKSNALFYFPSDIAQPIWNNDVSQQKYENEIAARMQELVLCSGGRSFLLFSSNRMMNAVYQRLKVPYPVLKQGTMPKQEMIRQFKERPSVLLGVASFWEGVDVSGDALSLVAIDKLPFEPPDDPILQGTVNLIKRAGGNEWEEYIIPRLIIKLKQGVGRLIRSDTDRGVIAILDQRLFTKRYGKQIRMSMPQAPRTSNIDDVADFFGVECNKAVGF